MIAGLIRGHPLGVFFIVCLLLMIVETGLLLTALIVNTIVKYCQLERLPAVYLEGPRFFQLPFSRLLVDVLSRTQKSSSGNSGSFSVDVQTAIPESDEPQKTTVSSFRYTDLPTTGTTRRVCKTAREARHHS